MAAKHVLVIGLSGRMGGVETFIKNVTLASDPEAVQFDFLVHDGSGDAVYADEIARFYGPGRDHVHYVEPFKRNPAGSLSQMRKLRRSLPFRLDWVHLNTGSPAEVVYALPFLQNDTRLISHSHTGDGDGTVAQGIGRPVLNAKSTFELACSDRAANWLFGSRRADKALMVRNGIDVHAFSYSPENRETLRRSLDIGDEMVIGHIGRFHEVKNHRKIVTVFAEYLKSVPDARLCLVGVGDLMDETKALCRELDIGNRVLFLGARGDTAALYSAFDCFLMPSLYEGLPVVLVEAQASGLPVVMSDTISRDSIINPALCTVVPLGAPDGEWAAALPRATSRGRAGADRVVAKAGFDIREVARSMERLYRGDPSGFQRVGDAS